MVFLPNSAGNYGNLLHIRVTNFAKIASDPGAARQRAGLSGGRSNGAAATIGGVGVSS
jgi:hypothetical protein